MRRVAALAIRSAQENPVYYDAAIRRQTIVSGVVTSRLYINTAAHTPGGDGEAAAPCEQIEAFLKRCSEATEQYYQDTFAPRAENLYTDATMREKLRFRPYVLSATSEIKTRGKRMEVIFHVIVSRGGRVISREEVRAVFTARHGEAFLTQVSVPSQHKDKKHKRKKPRQKKSIKNKGKNKKKGSG
jgi:hypothetical protein